jgi:retron-type reverse transcriptase
MAKSETVWYCKREVWEHKRVKANQGAAGVDGQSIEEFEEDLSNNLYRIWVGCHRAATSRHQCAGWTYRRARDEQTAGVPTVSDRIARR